MNRTGRTNRRSARSAACGAILLLTSILPIDASDDEAVRTDYVVAAQGVWLVSVSFSGAERGPSRNQASDHAMRSVTSRQTTNSRRSLV